MQETLFYGFHLLYILLVQTNFDISESIPFWLNLVMEKTSLMTS